MKEFFGFRKMASTTIIKFIYILGMIALTIGGIVMLLQGGEGVLIGLGVIILGNLFWRVFCEGSILLFSIHNILASVEKNLIRENTGKSTELTKGGEIASSRLSESSQSSHFDADAPQIPEDYNLSTNLAAEVIGVTVGIMRDYIKSGRVNVAPDGTISVAELRRAGFIIRQFPPRGG